MTYGIMFSNGLEIFIQNGVNVMKQLEIFFDKIHENTRYHPIYIPQAVFLLIMFLK